MKYSQCMAKHAAWMMITNDKDFGKKIYLERHPHHGVILLRLEDERTVIKIETLTRLLRNYSEQLAGQFVVVTESKARFAGNIKKMKNGAAS